MKFRDIVLYSASIHSQDLRVFVSEIDDAPLLSLDALEIRPRVQQ